MKFLDLLKLSTRMFKARTSRTILTVLGMGVGIGAILFLVSLGYGLQKTLLQKITTSDSLLTLDVTESGAEGSILNRESTNQIKELNGVSEVSPRFNINAQGKVNDLTADMTVAGIQPSFLRLGGTNIYRGESLSEGKPNGVVITSNIAQAFNKNSDEILNQEINFVFSIPLPDNSGQNGSSKVESKETYKIIGVIEADENTVYVNSSTLDYLNMDKFDQLKVKCASSGIMPAVREQIAGQGLSVSSLSDAVDQANKVFRVIQIILGCFGIVALIVSAIGMFNTMTIALLERTREIGIMKSIGASDFTISSIFITESTIMGFLGAVGGVFTGFLTGRFFNALVNVVATHLGGETVDLFFTPTWFIVVIIIFGTIVGCLTGVVPARRASNIDALEALHYK
jgi:ABC-type antimicrobial peptide transport system permease subunit